MPENIVYCPNCGNPSKSGAVFCMSCGKRLPGAVPSEVAQTVAASIPPASSQEIKQTEAYLVALRHVGFFANEYKLIREHKGKEYAGQYNRAQIARRVPLLLILVPAFIVLLTKVFTPYIQITFSMTLVVFIVAIFVQRSRAIHREIAKQQAALNNLKQS